MFVNVFLDEKRFPYRGGVVEGGPDDFLNRIKDGLLRLSEGGASESLQVT